MADDTLISAIERHEALAETYGNLSEDRTKALDYYLGNPMGNEVEGRSQVISRDVWDTVEWIKPQLAGIFTSGDEVVHFTPRGPDDVQSAEQETDYVNYIATQKNDWFSIWYAWSHDALLQKNGYVKAYWNDAEDRTRERYSGLTDDEFQVLQASIAEGAEIVEYDAVQYPGPAGIETRHTVVLERTTQYGCVKLCNVAPEHIYVDHNALGLSLQDPRVSFVEQREYKTLTQLRDEGFDVDDDIADGGDGVGDWEQDLRDEYSPFRDREGEQADPSMRRVKVRECWIRFDRNGDGRAELLHVILVGTTILLEEEADIIPVVALCPTPLPHQHYGLSVADAVMDLQRIKTALLRGSLDNVYLANNGRYAVDANSVNLDDMLVSRPGGVVRVQGPPGQAIFPLNHSTTGETGVSMMEYVDRVMAKRTGVSETMQGLDPNTLNNNAGQFANNAMISAAMQRIQFIARVFAETGVKALFQVIHALSLKNARQQEIIRVRNQWVPVDPRQWVKRADMQISVALGAGDKVQQLGFLSQILNLQKEALMAGAPLTDAQKVYNTLKRLTSVVGFKDPDEFWTDPSQVVPQEPQPDPEVVKEQAKAQAQLQVEQLKAQTQLQVAQIEGQIKLQEIEATRQLQESNDIRDAHRAELEAQLKAEVEALKQERQAFMEEAKLAMDKYKADLESWTRLQIADKQSRQNPPSPEEA